MTSLDEPTTNFGRDSLLSFMRRPREPKFYMDFEVKEDHFSEVESSDWRDVHRQRGRGRTARSGSRSTSSSRASSRSSRSSNSSRSPRDSRSFKPGSFKFEEDIFDRCSRRDNDICADYSSSDREDDARRSKEDSEEEYRPSSYSSRYSGHDSDASSSTWGGRFERYADNDDREWSCSSRESNNPKSCSTPRSTRSSRSAGSTSSSGSSRRRGSSRQKRRSAKKMFAQCDFLGGY